MPLLDIGISQSSLKSLGYSRVQLFRDGKVPNYSWIKCEERWASSQKFFQNPGNLNFSHGYLKKPYPKFLIKAVATIEPKCPVQCKHEEKESNVLQSSTEPVSSKDDFKSSSGDLEEVDEREKLRRKRISKANKGNTPWNKGKKHSPETLQLIRERTRLAMQNPKVKMKLENLGHAQSPETREKIGVGVRIGWQKRRERLMLQETCLHDWQNLIAEASRKGFLNEEELQWDSYKILNERLKQEWLDSIESRKAMRRPKGSKRAPKSLEQRRKIAEAIAAKWADPEYRTRVCSALAKYHGTPEGVERKVRKKPSGEAVSRKSSKEKVSDAQTSAANEIKPRTQQPKIKKKKKNPPKYKDPLATSKLELLRSIRAQRVASETKTNEALERAKLLIAEAEKAAKALEVAALRSPVAQASLIEARRLIAEAIQTTKSIENGEITTQDDFASGHQTRVKNDGENPTEEANQACSKVVNGIVPPQSSEAQNRATNLDKPTMLDEMDMNYQLPTSFGGYEFPNLDVESFIEELDLRGLMDEHLSEPSDDIIVKSIYLPNGVKSQNREEKIPCNSKTVTKKWVRGRLVEVLEGE